MPPKFWIMVTRTTYPNSIDKAVLPTPFYDREVANAALQSLKEEAAFQETFRQYPYQPRYEYSVVTEI